MITLAEVIFPTNDCVELVFDCSLNSSVNPINLGADGDANGHDNLVVNLTADFGIYGFQIDCPEIATDSLLDGIYTDS